jgi:hypothetical protein
MLFQQVVFTKYCVYTHWSLYKAIGWLLPMMACEHPHMLGSKACWWLSCLSWAKSPQNPWWLLCEENLRGFKEVLVNHFSLTLTFAMEAVLHQFLIRLWLLMSSQASCLFCHKVCLHTLQQLAAEGNQLLSNKEASSLVSVICIVCFSVVLWDKNHRELTPWWQLLTVSVSNKVSALKRSLLILH